VNPEAQQALAEQEATEHYYLAKNYFEKWQLDLAEIEYDEAIKCSPDMKIAHRDMWLLSLCKLNIPRSFAEMIMVTGLADPVALNDKERAELDQRAMHLHYKKAISVVSDGKAWDEAITELRWAMTYAPDSTAIHHSLAFVYASKGDFKLAEQEYSKTFALAPTDGVAHADFANLLADKGQADRAQEEMRKAVQLSPTAAALHVDLGWMAESRSDVNTAATEFKKAVELSPNHAGLWAHLGRLLEKQGQVADAQSAYAKALGLDPALTEAKESLDRLKQPQKQSGA
jgi:Tfp pilus assembly protein PilF